MSAATPLSAPVDLQGARLRFTGLLRSEWIKLRSVRSTMWCYGIMIVLSVGFGVLLAAAGSFGDGGQVTAEAQNSIVVRVATFSVNFTQLIAAVLGVLVISGEYGTGMIRSTMTAAPRRTGAYLAKGLVLGVVTFVVGLVSIGLTLAAATPILSGQGVEPHLADGGVWLALIGGAGYLALIALLAYAFGAVVRSSAGGIACIVGLLLVVPTVMQMAAALANMTWLLNASKFLPSSAGAPLFHYPLSDTLWGSVGNDGLVSVTTFEGLVVTVIWVLAVGLLGAVLIKRRDV